MGTIMDLTVLHTAIEELPWRSMRHWFVIFLKYKFNFFETVADFLTAESELQLFCFKLIISNHFGSTADPWTIWVQLCWSTYSYTEIVFSLFFFPVNTVSPSYLWDSHICTFNQPQIESNIFIFPTVVPQPRIFPMVGWIHRYEVTTVESKVIYRFLAPLTLMLFKVNCTCDLGLSDKSLETSLTHHSCLSSRHPLPSLVHNYYNACSQPSLVKLETFNLPPLSHVYIPLQRSHLKGLNREIAWTDLCFIKATLKS